MRLKKALGVVLAAVLLVGVTSCSPFVDEVLESTTAEATGAQPSSAEPSMAQPAAPTETSKEQAPSKDIEAVGSEDLAVGDHGPATCDDVGVGPDTAVPPLLAELGVPFYECVEQMSAVPGSDPLFVGEYDTAQESIVLEMFMKDQFEISDWEVISNSVDGDNAITQAQKSGYFLVVAIGPSRTLGAVSSIHYTLRPQ